VPRRRRISQHVAHRKSVSRAVPLVYQLELARPAQTGLGVEPRLGDTSEPGAAEQPGGFVGQSREVLARRLDDSIGEDEARADDDDARVADQDAEQGRDQVLDITVSG
jgi:hypothetical protein